MRYRGLLLVLVALAVLVAGCSHPPNTSFNPSIWPPPSPPPPPPVTPLQPRATPTSTPTPTPATPAPSPSGEPSGPGNAAKGQALFAASCAICHSPQQPFAPGKGTPVGPGLAGILTKGEEHTRESIIEPAAKVAEGFAPAMPDSFDQQLCGRKASRPADVADCAALIDLVAYLLSLKAP